jgi:hypothetical protein
VGGEPLAGQAPRSTTPRPGLQRSSAPDHSQRPFHTPRNLETPERVPPARFPQTNELSRRLLSLSYE